MINDEKGRYIFDCLIFNVCAGCSPAQIKYKDVRYEIFTGKFVMLAVNGSVDGAGGETYPYPREDTGNRKMRLCFLKDINLASTSS